MRTFTYKLLIVLFLFTVKIGFLQAQTPIVPPYQLDFEDPAEVEEWTFEADFNYWYLGAPGAYEGENGLFVTYDDESNEYLGYSGAVSHFFHLVEVPAGGMILEFEYRVGGIPGEDILLIGLLPQNQIPQVSYGRDRYTYLEELCCTSDQWVHKTINIPASEAGNRILVFTWENGASGEVDPPAAIDNLVLTPVNCLVPADLLSTQLYADGTDLTWTNNNSGNDYIISYKLTTEQTWTEVEYTGEATYQLRGLLANSEYQIRIRSVCSESVSSDFTEAIIITTLPSCYMPSDLTVTEILDESVSLSWQQGQDGNNDFQLSYTLVNQNDWTTIPVTGTSHTIQGLVAGNTYQIRLVSVCGPGDESEYLEIETRTTCTLLTGQLPFEEGFEGQMFPPQCWQYVKVSGATDDIQWRKIRTGEQVHTGTGAALFDSYNLASGDSAALITPRLDLSSENNKKLIFSIYRNDAYMGGSLEGLAVYISDQPEVAGASELIHISRVYSFEPIEDEIGWYTYAVDLSDSEFDEAYLIFVGISENGDNVIIDDIKVVETQYNESTIDESICEGEDYNFYGRVITEAGQYTHIIFTNTETDNLITLNLTVDAIPTAPNITRVNQGGVIYLVSDIAVGLQWYKDGVAIEGAIAARYDITEDGEYYVTSSNECGESEPSNTISIEHVSVPVLTTENVSVYPNPASGEVTIFNSDKLIERVNIISVDGKVLMEKTVNNNSVNIDLGNINSGLYIINYWIEGQMNSSKLRINR